MDQLTSMRTFARVAELGSFTRAADALDLSRAVVSTHVADLERHLGVKLLHRTTRKVSLTPDGSEYLERTRRILAEIEAADEVVKRARHKPQGRLRIDVPTEFGRRLLMPALGRFTARYPDLSLEVSYNDRYIDLFEEQVDLAVRVGPIGSPDLVARRVCRTRLLTCASPAYLEQHGVPLEPEQLRKHKLIGSIAGTTRRPRKWMFQKGKQRFQLALPFTVAFNTAAEPVNAAVHGAGIVQAMDMLVANHIVARRLEIILSPWSAEGAPISVVYPSELRNSIKVRVFADFAAELLLQSRAQSDAMLAAGA
ncbi:MAG TPA: LysR substrate-binding domain-containing protein [Steroidobacteraceae bacterium]|nr:LysR substrate-binding domain-containing protein [Steroidobacteraceae bacterium]